MCGPNRRSDDRRAIAVDVAGIDGNVSRSVARGLPIQPESVGPVEVRNIDDRIELRHGGKSLLLGLGFLSVFSVAFVLLVVVI